MVKQEKFLALKDFANWNNAVAQLLSASGSDAIGDALAIALEIFLDFDRIFIAALHRHAAPSVPYYGGSNQPELKYHEGPYLLDPFYNHFLKKAGDGCYRLADLAPEGFLRSEYFANYYRWLKFSDELGLLGSKLINYLC